MKCCSRRTDPESGRVDHGRRSSHGEADRVYRGDGAECGGEGGDGGDGQDGGE